MKPIDQNQLSHVAPIIGYHRAPLSQKFGTPRQPNLVALISVIEMVTPYDNPAAFVGLEAFSHIWLSWQFHHNYINKEGGHIAGQAPQIKASGATNNPTFRPQVRPPRLGGNQRIGVFASRSMYRPSGLGLSVVKLERIEVLEGRVLVMISGADMIDGTPIIDIKPYVSYSDAHSDAASGFAPSAPELLKVIVADLTQDQFIQMVATNASNNKNSETSAITIYQVQQQLIAADIDYIKALIAQDPRPAYRRDELNSTFIMRYKSVDISFTQIELGQLQITAIEEV